MNFDNIIPEISQLPVCLFFSVTSASYNIFINLFPNDKFHSSKLKGFAGDNFKFDDNSKKLSKQVGNTEGKGEIARKEQFLLFPQCFQRTKL